MSNTTDDSIATTCNSCGLANPDGLANCAGCGNSMVSAPPPADSPLKGKSKVAAIVFTLAFGPLGLLYVHAWGTAFLVFVVAVMLIATGKGGLWIGITGRIFCAIWAYRILVEADDSPDPSRDALRLLDEAARLEGVDRAKAIEAYNEIIRLYPGISASKEAARNIEALNRPI